MPSFHSSTMDRLKDEIKQPIIQAHIQKTLYWLKDYFLQMRIHIIMLFLQVHGSTPICITI
jgi:hypothetical protein